MLICDTSGLIAFFDASDAAHKPVSIAVEQSGGPFIVSPYVIAELDYLLATRRGVAAELAAMRELAGGAWDVPALDAESLGQAADVVERYQGQNIGIADASMVVLAARYGTDRVLTLDHRHFTVLRTLSGKPFQLVPSDSHATDR
jgi:predicted nucleic acid-binding protein